MNYLLHIYLVVSGLHLLSLNQSEAMGMTPSCRNLLQPESRQSTLKIASEYPDIAYPLRDPEGFRNEMNRRFREAKKRNPDRPLAFDYSEVGIPAVKGMSEMIPRKVQELEVWQKELARSGILPFWFPKSLGWLFPLTIRKSLGQKMINEVEIGLKYLKDLNTEIQGILKANRVEYLQIIELSYFFTRAIGIFDRYQFTSKYKVLMLSEYFLQGYRDLNLSVEYAMYKARDFSLFQYYSANRSTRVSARMLDRAFANQERLEFLLLPTYNDLVESVFYRLHPHYIYPVAITDVPIPGDGVLRHGGLFYMHDVNHSALMYRRIKPYLDTLTETQAVEIRKKMVKWLDEFHDALEKLEDPAMKIAIRKLSFNIHHERGYAFAPSTILNMKKPPGTSYILFFLYEFTGQNPDLGARPYANIPAAFKWLKEFWAQRAEEEATVLSMPR